MEKSLLSKATDHEGCDHAKANASIGWNAAPDSIPIASTKSPPPRTFYPWTSLPKALKFMVIEQMWDPKPEHVWVKFGFVDHYELLDPKHATASFEPPDYYWKGTILPLLLTNKEFHAIVVRLFFGLKWFSVKHFRPPPLGMAQFVTKLKIAIDLSMAALAKELNCRTMRLFFRPAITPGRRSVRNYSRALTGPKLYHFINKDFKFKGGDMERFFPSLQILVIDLDMHAEEHYVDMDRQEDYSGIKHFHWDGSPCLQPQTIMQIFEKNFRGFEPEVDSSKVEVIVQDYSTCPCQRAITDAFRLAFDGRLQGMGPPPPLKSKRPPGSAKRGTPLQKSTQPSRSAKRATLIDAESDSLFGNGNGKRRKQ